MNGREERYDVSMTLTATPDMCYYCFEVLHYEFNQNSPKNRKRKGVPLSLPDPVTYNIPTIECPLFVGWKKQSSRGGHKLRGCKGTHGTLPLHEGLRQYALLSAFDDSRFSQMREEELPRLTCSVSLLFGFEKISHPYDWEVGVHGLRIDFVDKQGIARSATFLPSVAPQFGYNQRQTVERLIEKAGCNEPLTRKLEKVIKAVRFQAADSAASYEEFVNYSNNRKRLSASSA